MNKDEPNKKHLTNSLFAILSVSPLNSLSQLYNTLA